MDRQTNLRETCLDTDTIAAVSTPAGEGGIGIIRISGPGAIPLAQRLFRRANGLRLDDPQPFRQYYGHCVDPSTQAMLDEVLLCVMRAPRSYTREDVVEISAHGGPAPLRAILHTVCASGARLARPGEFTERAFVNGRIDLTQAEAVLDTIRSRTDAGLRAAQRHLHGEMGRRVSELRQQLVTLLASLEAAIDYADEELVLLDSVEIRAQLEDIRTELQQLIASHQRGRLLREGALVAIIGRPNTGKSSLLNRLLGETRAIVTAVPGTTRDVIEEQWAIAGIPLRLLDTAGIRETEDVVERIGVERSRASLAQADLVLLIIDGSEPLTLADSHLLDAVRERPTIVVLNKSDLPSSVTPAQLGNVLPASVVSLSASTGEGIETLEQRITTQFGMGSAITESPTLANLRQRDAAERAMLSVQQAMDTLDIGGTEELLAVDLMAAAAALGEITGEDIREEVIRDLFARFCVGK